jgi:hypothetical protein
MHLTCHLLDGRTQLYWGYPPHQTSSSSGPKASLKSAIRGGRMADLKKALGPFLGEVWGCAHTEKMYMYTQKMPGREASKLRMGWPIICGTFFVS